ncbi:hypothetical protein [Corynebacterium sp. AOP40-4SA-5]|uniref:hypothetical protein n=1 Tax=Corynebacterium sp. AOP40-4SA-5 TaxID=3457678 RepID=UPI004034A1D2
MSTDHEASSPLSQILEQYSSRAIFKEAIEPLTVRAAVQSMMRDVTGASRTAEIIRQSMIPRMPVIRMPDIHIVGSLAREHLEDIAALQTFAKGQAELMAPIASALAESIQAQINPTMLRDYAEISRALSSVGRIDFSRFSQIVESDDGVQEVVDAIEADDDRREAIIEFFILARSQLIRAGVSVPAQASVVLGLMLLFVYLDLTHNPLSGSIGGGAGLLGDRVIDAQTKKREEIIGMREQEGEFE